MNRKKYKMIVIFLIFLLVVGLFGVFVKISSQQPEKSSENPPSNQWLFPDCPGTTAKFLDLHPDFKANPSLLKSWVKPFFLTYWEIKDWLENGFRSDDSGFVRWVLFIEAEKITDFSVKVKYRYPNLLKEIVSVDELRNKYDEWKRNNG